MVRIAICEDSERTLQLLKKMVQGFLAIHQILAQIECYDQSRMLKFDVEEGKHFDLVLSDIEMPYIDGLHLASYVSAHLPDVLIIFITSYMKYTLDAFELSIFRYIPKNSIAERLPKALYDAVSLIQIQKDKYYVIETKSRFEKIAYRRIVSIHKEGKNSIFHLLNGEETRQRKSLTQVYEDLDSKDFAFADRGVIINLSQVVSIHDGKVEMQNGEEIFGSAVRLDGLKNELRQFWGNRL